MRRGTTTEPRPWSWDAIRLVAFDVDGTLYDQTALRLRIARDLLVHSLSARTLRVVSVLRTYRRIREQLGEAETENFERILISISRTATAVGRSQDAVRAIVSEWIETRPLPCLAGCRCTGVLELFARLREKGRLIGVLSDYPAHEKLEALGLTADHVVCSAQVGVLKPHPRGLTSLMAAAGVAPEATVLVGDRPDRDGIAARRAGTRVLIRSARALDGWRTFSRYDGGVFESLFR